MRLGLVILGAVLALGVSRTASAEGRAQSSTAWVKPVLAVTLLDGWRGRDAQLDLQPGTSTQREAAEPGQDLSLAVERMWSQVRAYRRPGGAELMLRGRF
jgi:hypothetical protein